MQDHHNIVVGSSHGWLALFNPRNRYMLLSNPLSGRLIELPPLVGEPFVPAAEEADLSRWSASKVIISGSPEEEDCRAVMIFPASERAAFCRPGRSHEWTPLGDWAAAAHLTLSRFCTDFVYSAVRKRYFGFLKSEIWWRQELLGWDPTELGLVRSNRLLRSYPGSHLLTSASYLVPAPAEHSDDLLLVSCQRANVRGDEVDYKVFRVDVDDDVGGMQLHLCESTLDDLVMFVGINHSFAVKASQFPQLKPNSIYFSDARQCFVDVGSKTFQTIEIFDYQNKTFSPVYYRSRHQNNPTHLSWFTPSHTPALLKELLLSYALV